ncbi:MAG: universal stress protein [Nakamurella sp.]
MTNDTGEIVVGVDGGAESVGAARWAAAAASRRGETLRLVTVYSPPWSPYPSLETSQVELSRMARAWAQDILADQVRDLRVRYPELAVRSVARSGHSVGILAEESLMASMTVVGGHGRAGLAALSVPVRLAAHAHGAVVVVPAAAAEDRPPGGDHPVVVGVDGAATGEPAIEFAFAEAASRNVPLYAVLAWDEGPLLRAAAGIPLPLDFTAANVRNRDLLDAAVEPAVHRHPDVIVHQYVVSGHPTERLLERSGDASLLVVGSRGHGGFAGMLIGSVSASMIAHARCPVAVVRG